jgi:hypothetical protein
MLLTFLVSLLSDEQLEPVAKIQFTQMSASKSATGTLGPVLKYQSVNFVFQVVTVFNRERNQFPEVVASAPWLGPGQLTLVNAVI